MIFDILHMDAGVRELLIGSATVEIEDVVDALSENGYHYIGTVDTDTIEQACDATFQKGWDVNNSVLWYMAEDPRPTTYGDIIYDSDEDMFHFVYHIGFKEVPEEFSDQLRRIILTDKQFTNNK